MKRLLDISQKGLIKLAKLNKRSNNMKLYCIYLHINKINHKVYVGQTCQQPEKR